jgi:hypothetical protein
VRVTSLVTGDAERPNTDTMAGCVTPGGVRRIRESLAGDISVQVRRNPARVVASAEITARPFEKVPGIPRAFEPASAPTRATRRARARDATRS